jgi:hypothetical protein
MLTKSAANVIVDTVALMAFVVLAASGALIHYTLPPGSGHFRTLWGLDRHQWGDLHFWIAIVLVGLMVLHVYLHWSWVVHVVKGSRPERSSLRVALASVLGVSLGIVAGLPFFAEVESVEESPHRMRSANLPKQPSETIDGSMTLQEIQDRTGVSAAVIVKELGLPPNVATDERMGRLRRQYSFEMDDVRTIVQKHRD